MCTKCEPKNYRDLTNQDKCDCIDGYFEDPTRIDPQC